MATPDPIQIFNESVDSLFQGWTVLQVSWVVCKIVWLCLPNFDPQACQLQLLPPAGFTLYQETEKCSQRVVATLVPSTPSFGHVLYIPQA